MDTIRLNILAGQQEKEEQFWKMLIPTGEVLSGLEWAEKGKDGEAGGERNRRHFIMPEEARNALLKIARNKPENIHLVLLAVLHVLLDRYNSGEQVVLFTPLYRSKKEGGIPDDIIPVRLEPVEDAGFLSLLGALKDHFVTAVTSRHYPVRYLWEKIRGESGSYAKLVLFYDGVQDTTEAERTGAEICFIISTGEKDMRLELSYPGSYTHRYMENIARHFFQLLSGLPASKNIPFRKIDFLDDQERARLHQLGRGLTAPGNGKESDRTSWSIIRHLRELAGACPDRIAFLDDRGEKTFGALDVSVRALAIRMQALGVGKGTAVAVLLERSIGMAETILSIWSLGAVYIPLDVQYPSLRILRILRDTNALLVSAAALLDPSFRLSVQTPMLLLDASQDPGSPEGQEGQTAGDLPGEEADDSPAYIIYTSGSTGEPKGAVLSHRGMMNNFAAKREQLDIGISSLIAQTASHTFDISIWQFFTGLTVGAGTIIFSKDSLLQADLFVRQLRERSVSHLQLVPSYLAGLLEYLGVSLPAFPDLRVLESTGEELQAGLARKWQELYPDIPLYNAYGPTETTIDVLHYRLGKDTAAYIPIGKPIPGATVYITDAGMGLCPEGVKGEICIGGAPVGAGYLNNPEKTWLVFGENRFEQLAEGGLYRTGDIGCWLGDGNIRYFGRRDQQVKIRGYRIEPGEIEGHLLHHPFVREAVVGVVRAPSGEKHICAYIVGGDLVNELLLKEHLTGRLPAYMIPSIFLFTDQLPKLPSGKVDRKALPIPSFGESADKLLPSTATEIKIAEIWKKLFGLEEIGINENFFRLGGDSIRAIQLSSRLLREDLKISIQDIFGYPTIRELATHCQRATTVISQKPVKGRSGLTPIQKHFLGKAAGNRHHFNQAVMLSLQERLTRRQLQAIAARLQEQHDALRMVYREEQGQVTQYNMGLDYPVSADSYDLSDEPAPPEKLREIAGHIQAHLYMEEGPMMRMALFHWNEEIRLLLVIHHLVVDGMSWRILLEDLDILLEQNRETVDGSYTLPPKTDSFQSWSASLEKYTGTEAFRAAAAYWKNNREWPSSLLPKNNNGGDNKAGTIQNCSFQLDKELTALLLTTANDAFGTTVQDLLLTGMALSMQQTFGAGRILVDLEGHGREDTGAGMDVSRTVGWFTTLYPVLLTAEEPGDLALTIQKNKESLRQIPNNGIDYGLLHYLDEGQGNLAASPVLFNYLGQFDTDFSKRNFRLATESFGNTISPDMERDHEVEIIGAITDGKLFMKIVFSRELYGEESMQTLANNYSVHLEAIIRYCSGLEIVRRTPSDFTYKGLEIAEADLLQQFPVQDIYTLTPLQEGILYHCLLEPDSPGYFIQLSYQMKGDVDLICAGKAFHRLVARYESLRTAFVVESHKRPLQIVLRERKGGFEYRDLRQEVKEQGREHPVKEVRLQDRKRNFDLKDDLLIRLTILETSADEYEFIWSYHHILMDGWCTGLLIRDFLSIYRSLLGGQEPVLPSPGRYAHYIRWLEQQDRTAAEEYWTSYLEAAGGRTVLPSRTVPIACAGEKTASHLLALDEPTTLQLKQLAAETGVTLYTVLQAAWAILLGHYNDSGDVIFGSVVSGRPSEVEGIETMVGLFINTIPVRGRFSQDMPLPELLRAIGKRALQSAQYDYYPLAVMRSGDLQGKDLISHILVFENYPVARELEEEWKSMRERGDKGFSIQGMEVFEQTNYDLSVIIAQGAQLNISFLYDKFKFDEVVIATMTARLEAILQQLALQKTSSVREIDPVLGEERQQLLRQEKDNRSPYPTDLSLNELFRRRVAENGAGLALVFRDEQYTFLELDRKAGQLAAVLRSRGLARRNEVIGIFLERSADVVIAISGIIRSGAGYLPISPYLPAGRIQYLLKDSGCRGLITNRALKGSIGELADTILLEEIADAALEEMTEPEEPASSEDLAYVIYTSGSTGNPKGVRIAHRNVINLIYGLDEIIYSQYKGALRLGLLSPFDFDASVQHVFASLLLGHTLYILPEEIRADGEKIMAFIDTHKIAVCDGTPTHLRICLETGSSFSRHLFHLLIAGEELPKRLVEELYATGYTAKITNLYGPTETCVDSSYFHIHPAALDGWERIPIGKPLPNQAIYILNSRFQPLPAGVTGELFIGGSGVSAGYHRQDELTRERFIPNPLIPGDRLYRTGDLGHWRSDGQLEYIARKDQQLKLRGFRIEPGEIEYQLEKLAGISEAVVVLKQDKGSSRLLAYYTSDREWAAGEIREYAEKQLPYYMVPSLFIRIDKIPRTSNSKTDNKALLAYDLPLPSPAGRIAPGNHLEEVISTIWKNVLGITRIGVTDNFFESGGSSLALVRVFGQLKKELRFSGSLVMLVQYPTIRSLALYITAQEKPDAPGLPGTRERQDMEAAEDRSHDLLQKRLSARTLRKRTS